MNSDNIKSACILATETHEEFIRIRAGIERLMLPAAQSCGLTPTRASVLHLIGKTENATVSKLVYALDFNQGNMSSICKKLEKDGFIEKSKSPSDERQTILTVTKKGEEAIDTIMDVFSFTEDSCWLTKQELEEARAALLVLKKTANKVNKMFALTLDEQKGAENA